MSEKQRNEPPVKLTRAEKREIQAIIRKYKGDGKAHSAQASIPYQAMYPDGICKVTANTFSKCIEFADISYQLAQADTKTAIFENLCDLYNSPTVIVAPITSRIHTKAKLPTHTLINDFEGLDKNSIILLEQVRTIDKQRLEQYLGMIPDDMVARVDKALAISVALEKIKATDV